MADCQELLGLPITQANMTSAESKESLVEVRELAWTPPGGDAPLWQDLSFTIHAGETLILQGQSGSGKSTLLRCVVHLEKPDRGEVLWRGEAITPATIRAFRRRVVYVHQTPVAIADRVGENLEFSREMARELGDEPGFTEEEQRELLGRLGLDDVDFSRRFDEFSVGEQQRLAFVRCLSVRPLVLFLDEPTASLDDANARRLEEVVSDYLAQDPRRAAVWITHNSEQQQRLDGRIIDLDELRHGAITKRAPSTP